MTFPMQKNIAAFIFALLASDNGTLTAGGSGDNTEVVGVIIDRNVHNMPLSALFAICWKAVLSAAATLSISWKIEHGAASDLSDATNYLTGASAVVGTGPGGGGTVRGCLQIPANLDGAKQYVRLKFTPDLSAANTDTATVASTAIFGGENITPAI